MCTCPRKFSFTYKSTFLFDMIHVHDIMIDSRLIWIYVTRKDTFAILNNNLRPLNWKTIRKTTWKLKGLEFLVLEKLLPIYSKWQDKTFFRSLRDERLFFSSRPMGQRGFTGKRKCPVAGGDMTANPGHRLSLSEPLISEMAWLKEQIHLSIPSNTKYQILKPNRKKYVFAQTSNLDLTH